MAARARDFYVDWEQATHDAVAVLKSHAGRHPYDRNLIDLVRRHALRH